ncbi:MAG: hypothetical protein EBR23_02505 [Planctomycetia bacterium]|nr:hypothetical protein [Planctomycetia bacterium]
MCISRIWKSFAGAALAAACAVAALTAAARGSIVVSVSGTSAAGNAVSLRAALSITGDAMSIVLDNTSPVDSTAAADVLASFYFDIAKGTSRPTLTYTGASGSLFLVKNGAADVPYSYTPQTYTQSAGLLSNIRATSSGDNSWQFLPMDPATNPFLGFGIGTVGNQTLAPNRFDTTVVGTGNTMINFGIYKGVDINPVGVLDGKYLVKNTATFTFTGLTGYTEANLVDRFTFGLGTSPDSMLTVSMPEPACLLGAGLGFLVMGCGYAAARRRTSARSASMSASVVAHEHISRQPPEPMKS